MQMISHDFRAKRRFPDQTRAQGVAMFMGVFIGATRPQAQSDVEQE